MTDPKEMTPKELVSAIYSSYGLITAEDTHDEVLARLTRLATLEAELQGYVSRETEWVEKATELHALNQIAIKKYAAMEAQLRAVTGELEAMSDAVSRIQYKGNINDTYCMVEGARLKSLFAAFASHMSGIAARAEWKTP
jgi:TolA-binding protein